MEAPEPAEVSEPIDENSVDSSSDDNQHEGIPIENGEVSPEEADEAAHSPAEIVEVRESRWDRLKAGTKKAGAVIVSMALLAGLPSGNNPKGITEDFRAPSGATAKPAPEFSGSLTPDGTLSLTEESGGTSNTERVELVTDPGGTTIERDEPFFHQIFTERAPDFQISSTDAETVRNQIGEFTDKVREAAIDPTVTNMQIVVGGWASSEARTGNPNEAVETNTGNVSVAQDRAELGREILDSMLAADGVTLPAGTEIQTISGEHSFSATELVAAQSVMDAVSFTGNVNDFSVAVENGEFANNTEVQSWRAEMLDAKRSTGFMLIVDREITTDPTIVFIEVTEKTLPVLKTLIASDSKAIKPEFDPRADTTKEMGSTDPFIDPIQGIYPGEVTAGTNSVKLTSVIGASGPKRVPLPNMPAVQLPKTLEKERQSSPQERVDTRVSAGPSAGRRPNRATLGRGTFVERT